MPKIIGAPLTKFPKYIRKDVSIDPADQMGDAMGDEITFGIGQKKDYEDALTYLEENVLIKSPDKWDIKEIITTIHRIAARTVLTHPCSAASGEGVKPGKYRKYMAQAPREQSSGENYDIGHIGGVFKALATSHDLRTASNFVKWVIKFFHTIKGEICTVEKLREIDLELQEIVKRKVGPAGITQWRDENFEGHTLGKWFSLFIKGPGKPYYSTEEGKEQKDLHDRARVDLSDRARRAGLYTPGEEQARDLVCKFFMSPDKIPGAMEKFASELIAMIKSEATNPIDIAVFAHEAITNIHPFPNGTGRTARLFCNALLMSYGYYPVSFNGNKTQYYRTVDAADIQGNVQELRALFITTMHQHMIPDFISAAYKGNIKILTTHLELGLNVNHLHPGKDNSTALHYACFGKQLEAALFLVAKGADINLRNKNGKSPVEYCGDQTFAEKLRAAKKEADDKAKAAPTATTIATADSSSKPDAKSAADVNAEKGPATTTTLTPAFAAATMAGATAAATPAAAPSAPASASGLAAAEATATPAPTPAPGPASEVTLKNSC